MATQIAIPLANVGRQMRACVHDDVALPPLALAHVVEDRDAARRLHDPAEAAGRASELGQPAGQAALPQRAVLRTIVAIHARGVVTRRRFGTSRRARRIVFPSAAGGLLVLAGLGRLQHRETKLPLGAGPLLGLRRQRRNPAVGRIDDQRRARAGALEGHEHIVIGARNVALGAALGAPLAAEHFRSQPIQFGALCRGEKFLVRVPGGSLQRRGVSSVQIPCRSGSPQAVFGDGAAAGVVPEAAGA